MFFEPKKCKALNSTCHVPMFGTRCPKGRWKMKHNLKASLRISIKLLSMAHSPAIGKADEKSTT